MKLKIQIMIGAAADSVLAFPVLALVMLVLFAGCNTNHAMTNQTPSIGLGQEYIPAGEQAQIDRNVAIHRDIQEITESKLVPLPRGQQPKQYGLTASQTWIRTRSTPICKHSSRAEAAFLVAPLLATIPICRP